MELTPEAVLVLLQEGNSRFRSNQTINRDMREQVNLTSGG